MSSGDRPSFDPKRARGAAGAFLFQNADDEVPREETSAQRPSKKNEISDDRPCTVSEIADRINRVLLENLPRELRVIGEISNLSRRNHWYFSLKDEQAVISCVAWASKARRFGFEVENGMQVVVTGSVQFYGPQGRCQLYVDKLEPVGAGALELRFRARCEELRQLGYFDPTRKKRPPIFPRRVAVITSETGAALQDVLDTLRRRCPAIEVVLADVRVQGAEAAGEIARALRAIGQQHERLRIDAVIITRGGGSMEDLWAFNERAVADALLDFPIPTIAAIGHETDTTIAELVADVRCATPTQAAMVVSPDRAELAVQVDHTARRMRQQIEQQLRYHAERLRYVERHLLRPEEILKSYRERLGSTARHLHHVIEGEVRNGRRRIDRAALAIERIRPHRLAAARMRTLDLNRFRLHRALRDRIHGARSAIMQQQRSLSLSVKYSVRASRSRFEQADSLLQSIDPMRVLHRGYSITRLAQTNGIIRSVKEVGPGDRLTTQLVDGAITSEVTEDKTASPASNQVATSNSRDSREEPRDIGDSATGRSSGPLDTDQLDLFGHER